jgi:hypothetical protein
MTYAILLAMFLVWIFVQGAGFDQTALAASVCNLGMVPGEITHMAPLGEAVPLGRGMSCVVDNDPINALTPLISMFLHGGWGHILGNALFFWVFGNNIETASALLISGLLSVCGPLRRRRTSSPNRLAAAHSGGIRRFGHSGRTWCSIPGSSRDAVHLLHHPHPDLAGPDLVVLLAAGRGFRR